MVTFGQAEAASWLTIAQNFGITAICLFALAVAVWRVGVWFARKVIEPAAARFVKFLDDLTTAIQTQSTALQTMAIELKHQKEWMADILERVENIQKMHSEEAKEWRETCAKFSEYLERDKRSQG